MQNTHPFYTLSPSHPPTHLPHPAPPILRKATANMLKSAASRVVTRRVNPFSLQQRAKSSVGTQRRGFATSTYMVGGIAAVGLGGVGYTMRLKKNTALKKEDVSNTDELRLVSLEELRRNEITIYRYLTCPFCGKVKAFLDQHKIPYKCVEVDPLTKSQLKGNNYSKVPFLKIKTDNGELTMADSYDIVSVLGEKVSAKGLVEDESVKQWREWGSEKFIRYVTLNLNRSLGDAYNSSAYIDVAEEIPWFNRQMSKLIGSITMYIIVQKVMTRPKLIKMGYDGKDERQALYAEVNHWITEGVAAKKFYGGSQPNLVDTDIYGIINAIRGLPVYMDILENTQAKEWIHRMDDACGNTQI